MIRVEFTTTNIPEEIKLETIHRINTTFASLAEDICINNGYVEATYLKPAVTTKLIIDNKELEDKFYQIISQDIEG